MSDILTPSDIEALRSGCNENGLDYPVWFGLAPKILKTLSIYELLLKLEDVVSDEEDVSVKTYEVLMQIDAAREGK